MEKRQTVLVMADRSAEITAQLAARFGSRCELLFAENEPDFGARAFPRRRDHRRAGRGAAAKCAGTFLAPAHLGRRGPNMRAWRAFRQALRSAMFPARSERSFPSMCWAVSSRFIARCRSYWSQQKAHVWQQHCEGQYNRGKRALVFGMGDLGANVARRLSAFGAQVTGVRRTKT